jgi:transcriptional regulator with XRE-family HTH domain
VPSSSASIVREARARRGLNQAELARRAGTTQTYISRVERGALSPSFATLQRLVHATGHRLDIGLVPLEPGNTLVYRLRSDLNHLTPAERIDQAMELSEFLTGVAAGGRRSR